ncbi:Lipase 1 [Cyphellophora attinorum]|uniref:Carboxylic ester hydrolase n=1 Tax=Cyphellophora attinorum TaxID=1664694 RepID=A0A0N1NZM9_9EURO|nr:Lipase 1 [Phialophora attinorum]KPI37883.1 Lipase 1 [Phialophora attinorum]
MADEVPLVAKDASPAKPATVIPSTDYKKATQVKDQNAAPSRTHNTPGVLCGWSVWSIMVFSFSLLAASLSLWLAKGSAGTIRDESSPPTVALQNGTYYGVYNPTYNQDMFLGMPYAAPPIDDLRFQKPQPFNSTWRGQRNATQCQQQCYNYPYPVGPLIGGTDDCLTINVVRPAGVRPDAKLPVAFWIHGGGLVSGSASQYNLSSIVDTSVAVGEPIIAVSIQYRLHARGFLWGPAMKRQGFGNLGFWDQRLALRWVQENIVAFGGDSGMVTIWGQSGGPRSVASLLTAFGGRDDGLFSAAIMQSGTGFHTDFREVKNESDLTWEKSYSKLLSLAGCENFAEEDSLDCLRTVPADQLAIWIGNVTWPPFLDIVDGDFIPSPRSELLRQNKFVPVPILIGTATDDGDYFSPRGISTTEQWEAYLRSGGAANDTIETISALYPDIPSLGLPATYPDRPKGTDAATYGTQWKRVMAFAGDRAMQAPRRSWVRAWTEAGATAYSYRFNTVTGDRPAAQGAGHSVEMPFLLFGEKVARMDGPAFDIFEDGKNDRAGDFRALAQVMQRRWVSFFNHRDPNRCRQCDGAGGMEWPVYDLERPENLVFDAGREGAVHVEEDTWRAEQLDYLDRKLWKVV